jgi:hypothetical protein
MESRVLPQGLLILEETHLTLNVSQIPHCDLVDSDLVDEWLECTYLKHPHIPNEGLCPADSRYHCIRELHPEHLRDIHYVIVRHIRIGHREIFNEDIPRIKYFQRTHGIEVAPRVCQFLHIGLLGELNREEGVHNIASIYPVKGVLVELRIRRGNVHTL